MDVEEALRVADAAVFAKTKENLSDIQKCVLQDSWQRQTYDQIAETRGYTRSHIANVGSELWKLLSDVLGEKVTKTNFRAALERRSHSAEVPQPQQEAQEETVSKNPDFVSREKAITESNANEYRQVTGEPFFDWTASEQNDGDQEQKCLNERNFMTLVGFPLPNVPVISEVDEITVPYQGLKSFEKEQAQFFFGREKDIQKLVEKLEQTNFVPLIGASGSGKSSVIRAGLLPRLEKNGWRILETILPGVEPLAELKRAFAQLFGRTEVREIYSLINTDGLCPVIERLSSSERLLLLVDQFEEVFTVCSNEEDRLRFIELLTQVAEMPTRQLAIITTMRVDFLEPCLSYPSLTQLMNQAVYLSSLAGADLERAISSPANLQGYQLETGLVGAILHDVGQEKGCLPLLQFALTELWEQRDRQTHKLTLAKYHHLGGVTGTLNRHAEQLYQSFTQQQRDWVKRIFLKLVRTGAEGKDTRQRQPKSKLLISISDDPFELQAISEVLLDQLVQGRLLVTGQEPEGEAWVDLAHEALMDRWERFVIWRQEGRELRRLIDRIDDALREWLRNKKNENDLMSRGLLTSVREQWQELEPYLDAIARQFYQQSDAHEQEQQQLTERVEAELRNALVKEQELSELKSRFISMTSHEFRTPLTIILSSTELLELYGHRFSEEKRHNHFQRIKNSVHHLNQLLSDVLLIGKAEVGRIKFNPCSIDLVVFCRNLVEEMQPIVTSQHTLNFMTPGNCFDAYLDEKLLRHIITNLLSNAIKFSPQAGIIQFDLVCNQESAIFRIQDSGIGIPPEDQEYLFDSFHRASNVGSIPGTGLGLAIVQKCVELHNGTIVLESVVGVGTTCTVTLPLR